jgi:hypothetical protein
MLIFCFSDRRGQILHSQSQRYLGPSIMLTMLKDGECFPMCILQVLTSPPRRYCVLCMHSWYVKLIFYFEFVYPSNRADNTQGLTIGNILVNRFLEVRQTSSYSNFVLTLSYLNHRDHCSPSSSCKHKTPPQFNPIFALTRLLRPCSLQVTVQNILCVRLYLHLRTRHWYPPSYHSGVDDMPLTSIYS